MTTNMESLSTSASELDYLPMDRLSMNEFVEVVLSHLESTPPWNTEDLVFFQYYARPHIESGVVCLQFGQKQKIQEYELNQKQYFQVIEMSYESPIYSINLETLKNGSGKIFFWKRRDAKALATELEQFAKATNINRLNQ
ncbi:hypothetical protein RFI_04411, partial [Reticulomyxa filosa]